MGSGSLGRGARWDLQDSQDSQDLQGSPWDPLRHARDACRATPQERQSAGINPLMLVTASGSVQHTATSPACLRHERELYRQAEKGAQQRKSIEESLLRNIFYCSDHACADEKPTFSKGEPGADEEVSSKFLWWTLHEHLGFPSLSWPDHRVIQWMEDGPAFWIFGRLEENVRFPVSCTNWSRRLPAALPWWRHSNVGERISHNHSHIALLFFDSTCAHTSLTETYRYCEWYNNERLILRRPIWSDDGYSC